jgi:O-antigen ligase
LKPIVFLTIGMIVVILGGRWLAGRILAGTLNIQLGGDEFRRVAQLANVLQTGSIDARVTTGRTVIWLTGIGDWSHSPIIGLGLTAFDRVRGVDMEIHNTYLRVLGESGIIGMTAFLVLTASLIVAIVRCQDRSIHVLGLGFLFVQFPLMMSTGGTFLLRNHNLITGCMIGLLIGTTRLVTRQNALPIDVDTHSSPSFTGTS